MQQEIEDFILYLATERGLSDNYQLSTRISLEGFNTWAALTPQLPSPGHGQLQHLYDYLAHKKQAGLSAASI
jgi:integrase/recombinase XerD